MSMTGTTSATMATAVDFSSVPPRETWTWLSSLHFRQASTIDKDILLLILFGFEAHHFSIFTFHWSTMFSVKASEAFLHIHWFLWAIHCSSFFGSLQEFLLNRKGGRSEYSPILARDETKIQRAMMKGISTRSKSTWKTSYSCFACPSCAGL